MPVIQTDLKGVFIIEPKVFGDSRGWFMETWSKAKFEAEGLNFDFVQDNQSFSAQKGTLRGLHYQLNPMAQAKLVRCTQGELLDVAVDIRKNSPQFGKWTSVILSAENKRQLLIPRGFAHGFITLTDNVEVQYKADNFYAPQCEGNIRWNDPQIGIDWKISPTILADKDANAPYLKDRIENEQINFIFDEKA
jgi:dTDP-4-dehydrorhamnose 3,5-epimerase